MKRAVFAAVAGLAAALVVVPSAAAIDEVNTQRLRNGVTAAGILEHMRGFQRVANANGGNRAATTPGYEASLAYVERRLARAGYETERHPFDFATWEQNAPATFAREGSGAVRRGHRLRRGPVLRVRERDRCHSSRPATSRSRRRAVPAAGRAAASARDWPAGDQPLAGRIALIQRGTCPFTAEDPLADDLGAAGVIIFNDGFPGREEAADGISAPTLRRHPRAERQLRRRRPRSTTRCSRAP